METVLMFNEAGRSLFEMDGKFKLYDFKIIPSIHQTWNFRKYLEREIWRNY